MVGKYVHQLIGTGLSWLPLPVVTHLANAQKEVLKACQAVLEEQIKWTDFHLKNATEIRKERCQKEEEETESVTT